MLLQVDRLSFSFDDKEVINNISIEMQPGLFYGLLGPNGSGKTTFLDLLVRHQKPDSGSITFKGKRLEGYTRTELAKEIALVEQTFQINFPYGAEEVVMMGRHPYIGRFSSPSADDYAMVETIMKKTGAHEFKGRKVTELSGGEKQRVVFAKALAQDTPVLILDEATSNLDIHHAIQMLNLVKTDVANKNKTVIAVFQDINLAAAYCDKLIVLKHGTVNAFGPVESTLNDQMIKEVFGVDAKVYFEPFAHAFQVVFKR